MFRLAGVAALMAGAAEAYNGGGGGGGNPLEALTGACAEANSGFRRLQPGTIQDAWVHLMDHKAAGMSLDCAKAAMDMIKPDPNIAAILSAFCAFGQKPGDVGQYYECTQATYKVGDATKR